MAKNVKIRNNSPSMGRLLRARERLIHASCNIVPEQVVTGDDGEVIRTIPAHAVSLRNPFRNPARVDGKKVAGKQVRA